MAAPSYGGPSPHVTVGFDAKSLRLLRDVRRRHCLLLLLALLLFFSPVDKVSALRSQTDLFHRVPVARQPRVKADDVF